MFSRLLSNLSTLWSTFHLRNNQRKCNIIHATTAADISLNDTLGQPTQYFNPSLICYITLCNICTSGSLLHLLISSLVWKMLTIPALKIQCKTKPQMAMKSPNVTRWTGRSKPSLQVATLFALHYFPPIVDLFSSNIPSCSAPFVLSACLFTAHRVLSHCRPEATVTGG